MNIIKKIKRLFKNFKGIKLLPETSHMLPPVHQPDFEPVDLKSIISKKIEKLNKQYRENGELELSPFEKAKLIEVTLAEYVQFDPRFVLYDVFEKEWREIYYNEADTSNVLDPNMVCRKWAKAYIDLVMEFTGLKEEQVEFKNQHHVSVVLHNLEHYFMDENGDKVVIVDDYRVDSTKDDEFNNNQQSLFLLKEKLIDTSCSEDSKKIVYLFSFLPTRLLFNERDFTSKPVEYTNLYFKMLENVDKRIGYISDTLGYNNIFFETLEKEFALVDSDSEIVSKEQESAANTLGIKYANNKVMEDKASVFKKKFEFLMKVLKFERMHVIEASQYVRFAVNHCFSYEELLENQVKGKEIFYKKDGKLYFLNVFWLKQGEEYSYYILDPTISLDQNQIYPISLDNLKVFIKENKIMPASGKGEIPNVNLNKRPAIMGTPIM